MPPRPARPLQLPSKTRLIRQNRHLAAGQKNHYPLLAASQQGVVAKATKGGAGYSARVSGDSTTCSDTNQTCISFVRTSWLTMRSFVPSSLASEAFSA